MSDNEDNSQAATSTTNGAIGLLALHNPLAAHPSKNNLFFSILSTFLFLFERRIRATRT